MVKRLLVVSTLLLLGGSVLHEAVSSPATTGRTAPAVDSQAFLEEHSTVRQPSRPGDLHIRELLGQMTLKEKVGQMTQLTVAMITEGKNATLRVSPEKLRKAVGEYGVGSILNVNDLAMPVSWWNDTLRQIQAAAAQTRLKVPVLYGIDSIHGATYVNGATLFPQPLGMAATWNPQLMLEGSRVSAAETRAAGIPWNFSPVLDIGRQPLWPRLYETLGEDVHLATVMGVAAVRGYQGSDPAAPTQVAACLKHYVGYSLPASGHDRTPALIPELTLREYFLPTFAAGVQAGALSVMVNSGDVNGIPGHLNGYLLKDVLRGELGFDGVIVSDWEDVKKLASVHHAAANEKEATRLAVLAGIDMSMVPTDFSFSNLLVQLVEEGAVPMSRIDEAVGRILTMKQQLGLFDEPLRGMGARTAVGSAEARQAALRAARESITLLKNVDRVLPLSAQSRMLVTGPTADSLAALNNGWSVVWQGDREDAYPKDRQTVLGALRARRGPDAVVHVRGAAYDEEIDVAAAVEAARRADVVVLCLGEMSYAETPGNIDDLDLPDAQLSLARAVAAAGKPVVLVLVEGRPRIIRSVADLAKGIVMAYNPGLEGGQALADVLLGDVNPSGKLPVTYPRYANALRTYDHKSSEDQDTSYGFRAFQPQFEFGFGLSYTTFAYSSLAVEPKVMDAGGAAQVSVTVKNTGGRPGAEVVQLYVADHAASVTPPVKRLKRFAKLTLQPGESREVQFKIARDELSFIGPALKPIVEPGTFSVLVGGLKEDFELR
jgi:beta-glucosidase